MVICAFFAIEKFGSQVSLDLPELLYRLAPTQTSPVDKSQIHCPKTLLGTQVMHFRTSGRSTVIGYRRSPGSRIETKIGNDMSRPSVAKMHRSCFPFYLKNPKLNVQLAQKITPQNTSQQTKFAMPRTSRSLSSKLQIWQREIVLRKA